MLFGRSSQLDLYDVPPNRVSPQKRDTAKRLENSEQSSRELRNSRAAQTINRIRV